VEVERPDVLGEHAAGAVEDAAPRGRGEVDRAVHQVSRRAARVEDLEPYLDAVDNHPWLGVCFDTCHAWAAGHDLATPDGMTATLDRLVAAVGPGRLELVHANDSKDACGSTRDRHESVGAGTIGRAAFAELLAHPAVAGVPVIVETPNDDGTGHRADIARLKRLARRPVPA